MNNAATIDRQSNSEEDQQAVFIKKDSQAIKGPSVMSFGQKGGPAVRYAAIANNEA